MSKFGRASHHILKMLKFFISLKVIIDILLFHNINFYFNHLCFVYYNLFLDVSTVSSFFGLFLRSHSQCIHSLYRSAISKLNIVTILYKSLLFYSMYDM